MFVGPINPYVQTNSDNDIYLTTDDVELVARYGSIASQPLNFTWREGFYVWPRSSPQPNRRSLRFGPHNLTLQATDPFGETEYAYVEFDVLNLVSIDEPYMTGFAITEEEAAASEHAFPPGKNYGIGGGVHR